MSNQDLFITSMLNELEKVAAITRFKVSGKADPKEAHKSLKGIGKHIPFSGQRRKFHKDTGMRKGQYDAGRKIDKHLTRVDKAVHKAQYDTTRKHLAGQENTPLEGFRRRILSQEQDGRVEKAVNLADSISRKLRNRNTNVDFNMRNTSKPGKVGKRGKGDSMHIISSMNGKHRWDTTNDSSYKPSKAEGKERGK